MRRSTSLTATLALLLAFSSTALSLPSNPLRSASELIKRQQNPQRATVCGTIYGTGTRNDTYTRNLLQIDDAWVQGFIAPTTGAICSLSFFITPLPFSVSANASVAVYDGTVEQSQIFANNATPIAFANTLSKGDQLFFDFCGVQSGIIFEKQPYNLVLTFEGSALPAPLSLVFQPFAGASGSFFGPSFTPPFSLVDEALVFNLTASLEPPVCPGDQPAETTTSTSKPTESPTVLPVTTTTAEQVETSTVATESLTTSVEATSVVEPSQVTGETSSIAEPSQEPETSSSFAGTITFISPPVPSQVTGEPVTPGEPCTAVTVTVTTTETCTHPATSTTHSATSTSTPTTGVCGTECALCRDTAWSSCATAEAYTECLKSPTLLLCYQLACAPGQDTQAYLKQCAQLEIWARFTHDDEIPRRW